MEFKIRTHSDKISLKEKIEHLKGLGNQTIGNAIDFAEHAGICGKDDRHPLAEGAFQGQIPAGLRLPQAQSRADIEVTPRRRSRLHVNGAGEATCTDRQKSDVVFYPRIMIIFRSQGLWLPFCE